MTVATLQVKRVPDDLYGRVKDRAAAQGISLSEYVVRTLERDLELPTMKAWLDQVRSHRVSLPRSVDVHAILDDVKDEVGGP